jgi:hypothetical protein
MMTRDTVRRGLLGLLLLGVMLALTGCRGTVWSKKEEVRIGQQVAAEVEKVYKLDPDPAVQQRVQLNRAATGRRRRRQGLSVLVQGAGGQGN